jgi:hypothetical protein
VNELKDSRDESHVPPDEVFAMAVAEEQKARHKALHRWFLIKCAIGLALFVLVIGILSQPVILKSVKKMDMTQAISNSKQIYLLMMDFESDCGFFPDDDTEADVEFLHGFRGQHSNDYLGQLIAGGYTKSEEIFYAFDKRYSAKPDDVISPREKILQKGECGFGYVRAEEKIKGKNLVRGLSTSDKGGLPILIAPIVDVDGRVEPRSYKERGVYLRVDGSARSERLDSYNKIRVGPRTLFDTGEGTVWGTELKPVILLPER